MLVLVISESQAKPILIANSTAFLFTLGKVPGWPKVITEILVLGRFPYSVESELYILLAVSNWACTSSPTTSSYLSFVSCESILYFIIHSNIRPQKWQRFKPKTNQLD